MAAPASFPQDDVETIRANIACPDCDYNLRGLRGAVVHCPECGRRCDIAQLVSRRWVRPWWKAPGFNTTILPAAWAILFFIIGFPLLMVMVTNSPGWTTPVAMALCAVATVGWALLMRRAWRVFRGIAGWWLPMLAHLVAGIFIVAWWGLIGGILLVIGGSIEGDALPAVSGVAMAIICLPVAWVCRRGERYIGEQCIRNHLRGDERAG